MSWINVESGFVDVCENGLSAGEEDAVHRCDECERARDDLIAWADPVCQQREVESGRSGRGCDRMARARQPRECFFEGGHARTLREHSGVEHLEHRCLLFRPYPGP